MSTVNIVTIALGSFDAGLLVGILLFAYDKHKRRPS